MSQPVCRCDDPLYYHCGELRQWWEEAKRERDEARAEVERLRDKIADAPCLVARDGETTYECRADNLCRVCEWRAS